MGSKGRFFTMIEPHEHGDMIKVITRKHAIALSREQYKSLGREDIRTDEEALHDFIDVHLATPTTDKAVEMLGFNSDFIV